MNWIWIRKKYSFKHKLTFQQYSLGKIRNLVFEIDTIIGDETFDKSIRGMAEIQFPFEQAEPLLYFNDFLGSLEVRQYDRAMALTLSSDWLKCSHRSNFSSCGSPSSCDVEGQPWLVTLSLQQRLQQGLILKTKMLYINNILHIIL